MKPTKNEPKQNRKRANPDRGRFSSGYLGGEEGLDFSQNLIKLTPHSA
jgi:hypothetical protein